MQQANQKTNNRKKQKSFLSARPTQTSSLHKLTWSKVMDIAIYCWWDPALFLHRNGARLQFG